MSFKSLSVVVCFLGASQGALFGQLSVSQQEDIGLTALQTLLGVGVPTGEGVSVSMIEAPLGGNYRPNTAVFSGKDFSFPSAGSTGVSSHATTVAQYFFGTSSLAPDAGTTASSSSIHSYEANDWLQSGGLHSGDLMELPSIETQDVQNHSWIGTYGDDSADTEVIRRADYAITRDDYVMVAGLDNSAGDPPNLMSAAYNGISVGRSNGSHSYGGTSIDGVGRIRPDIVVPVSATSWASGTVSGAAALLIDTATSSGQSNAAKHELVKALLLNGATKDEAEFAGAWNRTETVPLDTIFGAGELNIERSYANLMAGEQAASAISFLDPSGWDYGEASETIGQSYYFEVPENASSTLTATLIWDRLVVATDTLPVPGVESYEFSSILADLNLQLYSTAGFSLDALLDRSISSVDNLEHIYFEGLGSGTYALVVSSDSVGDGQSYGFAWNNDIVSIPEPSSFLLLGVGSLLFSRSRKR